MFRLAVPANAYALYRTFQDSGVECRLIVYSGFGHGFNNSKEMRAATMALGATPSTIGKMIVSRGAGLAGIGVVVGLILSGIMAPLISSLLYGVRPIDLEVFIAVPLILMVVALLASYIPARRATRVNPIVALRES